MVSSISYQPALRMVNEGESNQLSPSQCDSLDGGLVSLLLKVRAQCFHGRLIESSQKAGQEFI